MKERRSVKKKSQQPSKQARAAGRTLQTPNQDQAASSKSPVSSPAAVPDTKSPGASPTDPSFPFSGQGFAHAVSKVLVPNMIADGHGPSIGDSTKESDRRSGIELAVKSMDYNQARIKWDQVAGNAYYSHSMNKMWRGFKSLLHNADRVRIYSKIDLQYLLYCSL